MASVHVASVCVASVRVASVRGASVRVASVRGATAIGGEIVPQMASLPPACQPTTQSDNKINTSDRQDAIIENLIIKHTPGVH